MRLSISLIAILWLSGGWGQEVRGQQALILPDSSALEIRTFDSSAVEAYQDRRGFDYGQRIRARSPLQTWWDRVKQRIQRFLFSDQFNGNIVSLVALVLLFLFVAMFFGKARFTRLFAKDTSEDVQTLSVFDQEVARDDIHRYIVTSEQSGDYRSALRWSFIGLLGTLDDAGLINAQRHKTNGDYRSEMEGSGAGERFEAVSRAFEYTWYGGQQITQSFYRVQVEAIAEVRKLAGL